MANRPFISNIFCRFLLDSAQNLHSNPNQVHVHAPPSKKWKTMAHHGTKPCRWCSTRHHITLSWWGLSRTVCWRGQRWSSNLQVCSFFVGTACMATCMYVGGPRVPFFRTENYPWTTGCHFIGVNHGLSVPGPDLEYLWTSLNHLWRSFTFFHYSRHQRPSSISYGHQKKRQWYQHPTRMQHKKPHHHFLPLALAKDCWRRHLAPEQTVGIYTWE